MSQSGIPLSALNRGGQLRWMTARKLDLLVIGGGITGAGIALDAASRGLTVGLVEKQDFAEGTSSRSTKLIHGGLRYLKQFELALVREVGSERAILHRNAPHLVTPERMLLPIVRGGTYGKLATSAGLWLYDLLAGVKPPERRCMLSKQQTLEAEPLLAEDRLRGGGMYYEYRTDDARLTVEVMKTAAQYGAHCVNYAEAVAFTYDERHRVTGAEVRDCIRDEMHTILAEKVVNATGPWVDELRARDGSCQGKRLHLTKGVHIVVSRNRAPIRQAVYFDVPDGRMIFAIPRVDTTYIGTTDTDYHGALEQPLVTRADVTYLLDAFNGMFPTAHLTTDDVQSSWAGLRPLIHSDGKSASELSRKDEILVSDSSLISIAGGKLTGYRKMAERVVDLVFSLFAKEKGYAYRGCFTDKIILSGGHALDHEQVEELKKNIMRSLVSRTGRESVSETECGDIVSRLLDKYGSNTAMVVSHILQSAESGIKAADAMLIGEFEYSMLYEMATRPSDFLIRRTGRLLFERDIAGLDYERICTHQPSELANAFRADERVWKQAYASATRFQHGED